MVNFRKEQVLLILFILMSLLAACEGTTNEVEQSLQAENTPAAEVSVTVESAPLESADAPTEPATGEGTEAAEAEAESEVAQVPDAMDSEETNTATPEPVPAEPVEVTFFTPAQQEGPYYPVDKQPDRDNDLVMLTGATALPAGQVLEFDGTIYGADGLPIEGAVIEIWQTDASGVYMHPNDPGTANRDRNFQFYGEAETGADGRYWFRTILPGLYEPRPRHIHVKVRLDGQEVLTTQFYFADEIDLQGADALMLIDAQPGENESGRMVLSGTRDIFLNITSSGG